MEEFLKTSTFSAVVRTGDWDQKATFECKGLLETSDVKIVILEH